MIGFLEDLAARRRFGMKPGLKTIRALCDSLGKPQEKFKSIHIAGTNGKGAVAAFLDSALRAVGNAGGAKRVGRYTSPHLVKINERFFLDGAPVDDEVLDRLASQVSAALQSLGEDGTFFEALTAVAFLLYAEAKVDYAILETGLGGRLDATNICKPALTIITKIGLDHCDWLGDTLEKIAAEKAGIIKQNVPIILGKNSREVRAVIEAAAKAAQAPFYYAPELVKEDELPQELALKGSFNRENAQTAVAALKVLSSQEDEKWTLTDEAMKALSQAVWPGRFQVVGSYLVDGAHNPPAAQALSEALSACATPNGLKLIFGACGDKDVDVVLKTLKAHVTQGYAVKTNNPRSLDAEDLAKKMEAVGIPTIPCASLAQAIKLTDSSSTGVSTLICGSLFLAGEALVALNAYPWAKDRFDPSESLKNLV